MSVNIEVREYAGRQCAFSGSAWEGKVGYSRAIRSGNFIAVSGTVGVNADGTFPPDLAGQMGRSLEVIKAAIEALGGKMEHVIRTSIAMADINKWSEIAPIHFEYFGEIRPASSISAAPTGIDPAVLVEVEVDCIIP